VADVETKVDLEEYDRVVETNKRLWEANKALLSQVEALRNSCATLMVDLQNARLVNRDLKKHVRMENRR
jgi:hypothetical protein